MQGERKLCKVGEAAKYLHMSAGTLKQLEATGMLMPSSVLESGHRRYLWEDVIAFRKRYERKEIPEYAELMSAPEVCCYCEFSDSVLRRLDNMGRLIPCLVLPPHNRRLYIPDDVEAYLESTRKTK